MAKIILVTGGARSGKSSYALELAESLAERKLFVATCPDLDAEMADRVTRHKKEREGRGWATIESQIDLASVFSTQARDYDVVLVDCITLWVNNILYIHDQRSVHVDDSTIAELCAAWLQQAGHLEATLILVTNEVGLGVVPDNALARKYRDLVGTCNQLIAKRADEVILVSCGLPLSLKQCRAVTTP